MWYVTGLSIGPLLDGSLECAEDAVFSPLLFELKQLRRLSFLGCFSSHRQTTIPSRHWEKLAGSLETLEFRSNQGLVGEVPADLAQLTRLQSLVLVDNSLSGELPRELGNLARLKRLALAGNRFCGYIPASLGSNMAELLILDLSRNSLTGSLPSSLGHLASLLKLDLSHNLLNGSIPSELGSLGSLTLLDLRNNELSGVLARAHTLHRMVSLQDLLLSDNPLGGSLSEVQWENLANLTTLDLSRANLSGAIPESIAGLKRLRFLALDNNRLSGSVSPKLATLPSLTALYLNGNNLTGELRFSDEFYRRMGRRSAFWDNPYLCHGSVGMPTGVEQCKQAQQTTSNPEDKAAYDGNPGKSWSMSTSFGLPASSISAWWGVRVRESVVALLLVMLLETLLIMHP
ncbi:piriformospora indica-insensitive protein 2-like isoform X2 [Musa acuminata AAA Group]